MKSWMLGGKCFERVRTEGQEANLEAIAADQKIDDEGASPTDGRSKEREETSGPRDPLEVKLTDVETVRDEQRKAE